MDALADRRNDVTMLSSTLPNQSSTLPLAFRPYARHTIDTNEYNIQGVNPLYRTVGQKY